MSSVGLVYVGLVLIVNGLMLLGWMTAREAGPLNIFVGGLQVVIPTYLIATAGADLEAIFAASGIYLFGFTYLWVGIGSLTGHSLRGFGWYALLVSLCTVVYAAESFTRAADAAFGAVWLLWGVLWFLFFVVLGLERETLSEATGFFTLVTGAVTAVVAFISLTGTWPGDWATAVVIAVVGGVALLVSVPAGARIRRVEGVVD